MKSRISAKHQGISITIEYDEHVYQPGLLTAALSDILEVRAGDRAIDVGCGTGYLGIVASLLGASEVIAIDPLPEAVWWTEHNARLNGISNMKVILGECLDPVAHLPADLIISNPPQLPFRENFSTWRYGGRCGTSVLLKLIRQSQRMLKKDEGRLFLVHAGLAYPAQVRESLSALGFQWQVVRTLEKELNPIDFEGFAPGLAEYVLGLADQGIVELVNRASRWFYPVWFYRASLGGDLR